MTMKRRDFLAVGLLLLAAACSKVPEDAAPDNSNLSEEQQIEEGAKTLEEAADKAMQIEIDSLNNVAPRADDESVDSSDTEKDKSKSDTKETAE
jgi:hypothetical protein